MPITQASISPLDRGFLFADGVYEVISVYGTKPFLVKPHHDRLVKGLTETRIPYMINREAFDQILQRLLHETGYQDATIYFQVTRGVGMKREHADASEITPTVFSMVSPFTFRTLAQLEQGCVTVTQIDERWSRCGEIKSIALLPNVLALYNAKQQDDEAVEVILTQDGLVQEGSSSTVVIQEQDKLVLPPYSPRLLRSITRDLLMDLAAGLSIPVVQRPITLAQLYQSDNVWLLSTTREVMPIKRIDDKPIADSRPSKMWYQVYQAYQDLKAEEFV